MKKLFVAIVLFASILTVNAQIVGKDARYCNPLPMPIGPGGNAGGDVSVMQFEGTYYMFCSGGGAWYSNDLVDWTFQAVEHVPGAPDVAHYNGKFYMTGNDSPVYVANNPLGPYTLLSDWKNVPSEEEGWKGSFDTHIFVDDDNQPYLFWPGHGATGIYASKLDPNDLSKFVGPVQHLITFNSAHQWERYGEANEYQSVAWIEGPWVYKCGDTYYLQYSASGTQWKSYAAGYYTSKNILGPYEYAGNNPLIKRTDGLVTGTGHGSMITGPDGGIWQFYTVVFSNPPGGRRIGMDRVYLDKNGLLTCKITDTPQWGPLVTPDPKQADRGDSGSLPLTVNKFDPNNAQSKISSQQSGFYAAYGVDNLSGTTWMPDPADKNPYLLIDLSPATSYDAAESFMVDGLRILFGAPSAGYPRTPRGAQFVPYIYKYKLEGSMDGEKWEVILDKSNNTESKNTIFDEVKPSECRYVKFTMLDWPKNGVLGIIDLTVFGKPAASFNRNSTFVTKFPTSAR